MPADIGGRDQLPLRHRLKRLERGDQIGQPHPFARISEHVGNAVITLDLIVRHAPDEDDAIGDRLDADLSNVFPDDHGHAGGDPSPQPAFDPWASQPGRQQASCEDYNLEAFVAGEKSLADHLADQLGLAVTDPTRLIIGHALIDEVDEAGYIRADLSALAERLGAPMALVEEVLATLQGFEPTGICARDLSECLALQLAEKNRLDPAIKALLDHLDLVARRDFAALKRVCGCNEDDIVDMLAELRALDPKPGASFGSAPVQPIVPDVMVRAAPDGS